VRVALTCPYDWAAPGGVQVHVRGLGRVLRARGHEVLVLAPASEAPGEPWVRAVGRPVRIPYAGTVAPIAPWPWTLGSVRRALRAFRPDVVHVHEPFTPSTSMAATWAAPAPVVATFHAYLGRSRLLEAAGPALRPLWGRLRVRVAVSEAAAAFLARAFPGPVEIVPNGVDVERFARAEPVAGLPQGRRVLWVGRLDPQKGFPVALRAFARVLREVPDACLVVAGDGRGRRALRDAPAEAARRVVSLGAVPHEDLPGYHAACHAFLAAATGQESFGIVLVEAMAAGLPVVCTDIPGYREVVRDGEEGLLAPPGDDAALAARLARVLRDADLARRLGEAGRRRASSYAWDGVAARLEELYERAAGA
jgi:phosphatidylinositol alpha-mannosyltransferase